MVYNVKMSDCRQYIIHRWELQFTREVLAGETCPTVPRATGFLKPCHVQKLLTPSVPSPSVLSLWELETNSCNLPPHLPGRWRQKCALERGNSWTPEAEVKHLTRLHYRGARRGWRNLAVKKFRVRTRQQIFFHWSPGTQCRILGSNGGDYEEWRLLGYKNPVRTSQETHYVSTTEPSKLMLCKIWGFHGSDYEECRLLRYKYPVRTSQEASRLRYRAKLINAL
jgi:hypothetical protein